MTSRPTVSLRFRDASLRERVRELAEHLGLSQNEFLLLAAQHEVVVRGALLADELDALATRLGEMSAATRREQIEASKEAFVAGEARPEPLRARQIRRAPEAAVPGTSRIGAVAAFGRL